jgi:hypothetical protein
MVQLLSYEEIRKEFKKISSTKIISEMLMKIPKMLVVAGLGVSSTVSSEIKPLMCLFSHNQPSYFII